MHPNPHPQCLDPDFGNDDSGEDDCQDIKSTAWCEKRKGKCHKFGVAKNCPKTCFSCACVDLKPTSWCEKKKGKCNKNHIKQKCPLTCGVCNAWSYKQATTTTKNWFSLKKD